jgi:hypothetical protein
LNRTLPLGFPAPGPITFTVAVSVTICPLLAGFGELVSDVVVSAFETTWDLSSFPVLPKKLPSPEYVAVMV